MNDGVMGQGPTPYLSPPDSAERKLYDQSVDEILARWRAGKPLARKVLESNIAGVRVTTHGLPMPMDLQEFGEMFEHDPLSKEMRDAPSVTARWIAHRLLNVASTPNIFEVSEALALRLLHTDLGGVRCDDVNMPFEAFAILIPRGLLQIWHTNTGFHDVTMVLVGMGWWSDEHADPRAVRARPGGRRMVVMVYGEPNKNSVAPQDDAALTTGVPWIPGTGIYSGIFPETYAPYPGVVAKLADGTEVEWYAFIRYMTRLIANLALYLSSPDRDVVEPAKEQLRKLEKKTGKKAKERRARLRESRIYIVGSKDRITEEERRVLLSDRRSATVRSLVRGHWRNQPHGPKRELRRFVWIKPHVRNKDIIESLKGRDYSVR